MFNGMLRSPVSDILQSPIGRRPFGIAPAVFNPISLFAANEQGTWYDPSDLSTLFQDAAGTTPVTASGQPVGLMLDKSKGLVLGPELVVNGDFSAGTAGWTVTGSVLLSVTGGAANIARNSGSLLDFPRQAVVTEGKRYTVSLDVIALTNTASVYVGGVEIVFSGTGKKSANVTAGGDGLGLRVGPTGGLTATCVLDNISVRELPGNHATQPTAGSRPIYRDVGGLRYLEFDGIDDGMFTGNINFTGTDKVSVFAGVRKLSDAAIGMLAEIGTGTVSGSFTVFAPRNAAAGDYGFRSRGTASSDATVSGFAAEHTAIITATGDIVGDISSVEINKLSKVVSTADQGTGNFGSYPIYIGRRGGYSLPFNGNLYGLIIRGALTDDATTIKVEQLLAAKTGVTLP